MANANTNPDRKHAIHAADVFVSMSVLVTKALTGVLLFAKNGQNL